MAPPDPGIDQSLRRSCQMLYAALRRHRRTTIMGWTVTAAGCVGMIRGWDLLSSRDIVSVGISLVAIVAGILLVHESVGFLAALSAWLQNEPPPAEADPVARELHARLKEIAREIDNGGWQEAFAALGQVRTLAASYGIELPG